MKKTELMHSKPHAHTHTHLIKITLDKTNRSKAKWNEMRYSSRKRSVHFNCHSSSVSWSGVLHSDTAHSVNWMKIQFWFKYRCQWMKCHNTWIGFFSLRPLYTKSNKNCEGKNTLYNQISKQIVSGRKGGAKYCAR